MPVTAVSGRWLTHEIYQLSIDDAELQLSAGELLMTDKRLCQEGGVSDMAVGHWRRHPHPALDGRVFGGRLRWLKVPKKDWKKPFDGKGTGGPRFKIMSSQKDWDEICRWRKQQQEHARSNQATGETASELAKRLRLKGLDDRFALAFVLRRFRQAVPSGAQQATSWDERRNRAVEEWRYDAAAVLRWLKRRDIHKLAAAVRRVQTEQTEARAGKRLERAKLFLIYVLTKGEYSARKFEQFAADPPRGKPLQPYQPGVQAEQVRQWAKQAGIGIGKGKAKTLGAAKIAFNVQHFRKGFQGPSYWRLREPVTLPLLSKNQLAGAPSKTTRMNRKNHERIKPPAHPTEDEGTHQRLDRNHQEHMATLNRIIQALEDNHGYVGPKTTELLAKAFGVHRNKLAELLRDQVIPNKKLGNNCYMIRADHWHPKM